MKSVFAAKTRLFAMRKKEYLPGLLAMAFAIVVLWQHFPAWALIAWYLGAAAFLTGDLMLARDFERSGGVFDAGQTRRWSIYAFMASTHVSILGIAFWRTHTIEGGVLAFVVWAAILLRNRSDYAEIGTVAVAASVPHIAYLMLVPHLIHGHHVMDDFEKHAALAVASGFFVVYVVSGWRRDAQDRAALMRAQEEAGRVAERLAFAVEGFDSAVGELDFRTRQLHATPNFEAVLLCPPDFDLFTRERRKIVHPEDADRVFALLDSIARAPGRVVYEFRSHPDLGPTRWLQAAARTQMGADGKLERMVFLTTNIGERKEREFAFLDAMRRAESVVEGKRTLLAELAREAAARVEPIEIANASLADSPAQRGPHDGFADMFARLDSLLAEINVRDEALADAVDALRRARLTAEAASQAKSQFLANMSHELRTPLNAVIGYAEILEEDLDASGEAASAADARRISTAARHLLGLISEILDLSKIEAGKMELVFADVPLADLVDECMEIARPLAEANANRLTLIAPDALPTIRTDGVKLRQCLLNLLSNACKFTREGAVTLSVATVARAGRGFLRFEVSDTGVGMSEEQVGRLFQPFVQADAAVARTFGGTGLGLAITRRLAQLLGGDVSVASKPGEGSIFVIEIPDRLHVAEPQAVEDDDAAVLMIDDEAPACDLVMRMLEPVGVHLRWAPTAAQGLASARRRPPALIVLDIGLPDQSGWTVLEALQADATLAEVPVIVLSVEDASQRAIASGACAAFLKPADRDQLASAVLRFMRRPEAIAPDPLPDVTASSAA